MIQSRIILWVTIAKLGHTGITMELVQMRPNVYLRKPFKLCLNLVDHYSLSIADIVLSS